MAPSVVRSAETAGNTERKSNQAVGSNEVKDLGTPAESMDGLVS